MVDTTTFAKEMELINNQLRMSLERLEKLKESTVTAHEEALKEGDPSAARRLEHTLNELNIKISQIRAIGPAPTPDG